MAESISSIADKFAKVRPGYQLVSVLEVGLPVTLLSVSVLAQERKGLPLLDEFILRGVDMGLTSSSAIAQLCGIQQSLVVSAAANQVASGNLLYDASTGRFELTTVGHHAAKELSILRPVRTEYRVNFDRVSWTPTGYGENDLLSKSECRRQGMIMLPPLKTSPISVNDVSVPRLNSLVSRKGRLAAQSQILRVQQLRTRHHKFLPIQMLVYHDSQRAELEFGILIGGSLSKEHEFALLSAGGLAGLGIAAPEPVPWRDPVEGLRAYLSTGKTDGEPVTEQSTNDEKMRSGSEIRPHIALLALYERAISSATARLLVSSDSWGDGPKSSTFILAVDRLLRSEVRVEIILNQDEDELQESVRQQILSWQKSFPGLLRVRFDSHFPSGLLLWDNSFLCTWIDWLRTTSDRPRTIQFPDGAQISDGRQVDALWERLLQ